MVTLELKSKVVGTRDMAKIYNPNAPIYRWVESVDSNGFASGGAGREWYVYPGEEAHLEILREAGLV